MRKPDFMIKNFANRTSHRLRIFRHLDRVKKSWEDNKINCSFPLSLEIHPSDICNLSCRFCAYKDLRIGNNLSRKVFFNLISEIIKEKRTKSVVFSGGGEPTCHSDLAEAIVRLTRAGIEVGVLANGVFLSEELLEAFLKCSWLRFSLNAAGEETYKNLNSSTRITFRKACQNIKTISQQRKRHSPILGISMVVHDKYDKLSYLKKFIDLAKILNVDYVMYRQLVKSKELETRVNEKSFKQWTEEIEKTAKRKKIIVNYKTFLREKFETDWQNRVYSRCPLVYDGLIALVSASGDVFPCVALYLTSKKEYSFGNLNEQSFKEVWRGRKRKQIVRKINAQECPYCRHDHMNEILLKYLSGEVKKQKCLDPHWKFL